MPAEALGIYPALADVLLLLLGYWRDATAAAATARDHIAAFLACGINQRHKVPGGLWPEVTRDCLSQRRYRRTRNLGRSP